MDSNRKAFEAHMLAQNACTRLARQADALGGNYRTVTVQRAWELWQASRQQMAQEAVKVADCYAERCSGTEQIVADHIADGIRALATQGEGG